MLGSTEKSILYGEVQENFTDSVRAYSCILLEEPDFWEIQSTPEHSKIYVVKPLENLDPRGLSQFSQQELYQSLHF